MAPGIGRRGKRGGRRGGSAIQGRHGGSAMPDGRGGSITQDGLVGSTSQGGRSGSATQGEFGGSTSLGGLSDSTSPFTSQQRRDDPSSSQAPYSSTAYPSATTSTAVRGPTCGKKTVLLAKSVTGAKLPITFDASCRQPICVNAERFNNEIGYIVRNHSIFHHKEWRLVPEDERAPLREYLLENFDINLRNKTTLKCIDEQMRKAWKGHKYKLHTYFKDIGGEDDCEMAKRTPHPDLKKEQQKDWEMLCDHWSSEKFKEWSVKNIEARSKRKWGSRNGSPERDTWLQPDPDTWLNQSRTRGTNQISTFGIIGSRHIA
ncbi:hypothetical protein TorRG33x02_083800 [Trema orientale]|uniref:Transposase, Ptta/En/Spm, plant n=1 Tax=Trema orientale TaxID=63057 RepID=A0A2P5FDJ7_TREOI|nr:hypothetical protein TorRG33x02_083800 [Trema orientale]